MMLYRTLDSIMPAFREIFLEFGITEQQWRVLHVLGENNGCNLQSLAQATLISSPSLVGVVDRLERVDLVERHRSEIDRRVVNIFVTNRGKALELAVQSRVDAAHAVLQTSITPTSWESLFKAMDEVANLATTTKN